MSVTSDQNYINYLQIEPNREQHLEVTKIHGKIDVFIKRNGLEAVCHRQLGKYFEMVDVFMGFGDIKKIIESHQLFQLTEISFGGISFMLIHSAVFSLHDIKLAVR